MEPVGVIALNGERSAPSSVTESAAEPPSWNRDDIRSTWLKSVGNN